MTTVLDDVGHLSRERTVPGHALPGQVLPDGAVPDGAVPDGAVPDGAVPEHAVADRPVPQRPVPVRASGDRAALARAALARAEQRTGARSGLRIGAPAPGGSPGASSSSSSAPPARRARPDAAPSGAVRPTDPPAPGAAGAATSASITHPDRPPLPVAPDLAALLPEGALRRGSSLVVTGSTSLVLALVARASQEGSWVAVVGLPRVGLLAAQQSGVVLDRLALVPRPGPDAATVVAALLDGVDLVVVGDGAALVDPDRRRLTARARERGSVLLSTAPWQGANVVLAAEPVEWTGLGPGHGHLRRHRLVVTRGGRGSAGRSASAEVVLPLRPEATGTRPGAAPVRRRVEAPSVPLRMVG